MSTPPANLVPAVHGATVEFRKVSKRYGGAGGAGTGAVHDLSLTVPRGEICVLVGPSGCGKTTTLKMVNRLVEPTSGQVLVDGQDVATVEVTALRRRIGYVIQQIGLFPHQTVAENVATVPRLLGWPKERIRARVDELLTLIGLEPGRVRARYPGQLSGGERQRVGVARALAAEPPVMLMDEPFGAVDPIVRERLQDEFLRLHRQLGMTVLFVTHDIDEAIKMGNRVAVMQVGGHLAQYAPPAELLMAPANDFVAQFVGDDRGLKRLALLSVTELPLQQAPVVREGETAAPASQEAHWLLLDRDNRPLGWIEAERARAGATREAVHAVPPCFVPTTSVRDALSALLIAPIQQGVVVDAQGKYRGVLTLESVATALRTATPAVAPHANVPAAAGGRR